MGLFEFSDIPRNRIKRLLHRLLQNTIIILRRLQLSPRAPQLGPELHQGLFSLLVMLLQNGVAFLAHGDDLFAPGLLVPFLAGNIISHGLVVVVHTLDLVAVLQQQLLLPAALEIKGCVLVVEVLQHHL